MFQAIRKHFNPASGVALLALVFAMSGGAFAMSSSGSRSSFRASASTVASAAKRKAKAKAPARGPAGPQGKTGPAGPQGVKGESGAPGKEGSAGKEGLQGKEGSAGKEGPEGKEGPAGKEGPEGKAAAGGGYPEVLPSEKSEHGVWGFHGPGGGVNYVPISFPIPLAAPLNEQHTILVHERETSKTTGCKGGSETNPIAEPGYLCIYVSHAGEFEEEGGTISSTEPVLPAVYEGTTGGVNPSGGLLQINNEGASGHGRGVWVVTAPFKEE